MAVNTVRFNARIDIVVDEKLRKLASDTGLTMSEIMRRLVENATPESLLTEKEKARLAKKNTQ